MNRLSVTLLLTVTSSEHMKSLTSDLQRLRQETWTANGERTRQFFFLKDSLDNLRHEIKDITTRVVNPDNNSIHRAMQPSEVEVLTTKVVNLSLSQQHFAKENAVIASLDFPHRIQRHEDIPEAHSDTFAWIFGRSEPSGSTKFVDWLERGEDVFWISGRPGSGKSTLMKFIDDSPSTRTHLTNWAGRKSIFIASHYFWSAGLPIQRSQEGLLRSLLYSLLSQIPKMIASACGERWIKSDVLTLYNHRWSHLELGDALRKAIQLRELPMKFAFFVDGLDEYEGDGSSISKLMLDLGRCPDVKLCVSSRPWNIFEDGFGRDPTRKLYVHESTQADIRRYAESRLSDHPRWLESSSSDVKLMESLASEITERAQGVFLWVILVIRLLREGITNYDSVADLWKRLESLPVDLEQFFRHILSSVESFYHEKMAGALLIALRAGDPLPLDIYSLHQDEYSDEDYALKLPMRLLEQDLEPLNSLTSRRLNGWCKGLVETRHKRVEFLHRTVRDFLRTGSMIAFLEEKAPRNFHPGLSLLKANVAWFKNSSYSAFVAQDLWSEKAGSLERKLGYVLRCAEGLNGENDCQNSCEALLDNIDCCMQKMFCSGQVRVIASQSHKAASSDNRLFFRKSVIMENLGSYLQRKLDKDPGYLKDFDQPPLSIVLNTWAQQVISKPSVDSVSRGLSKNCFQVLKLMLEYGEDINELMVEEFPNRTTTPWEEFVSFVLPDHNNKDVLIGVLESGIPYLLLSHGADLNACVSGLNACRSMHYDMSGNVPFWIGWLFQIFFLPYLWNYRDQYLQVLRTIFESKFSFKLMGISSPQNTISPSNLSLSESGICFWKHLCTGFAGLSLQNLSDQKSRFLTQVLVEFAKATKNEIRGWNMIVPHLRSLFPEAQLQDIFQALGKTGEQEAPKLRKRYRVPGEEVGHSHDTKKRKMMGD